MDHIRGPIIIDDANFATAIFEIVCPYDVHISWTYLNLTCNVQI